LRAGLEEARTSPVVLRAVILVPAVTALWGALEEYTPLLAGAVGIAVADVPWWQAVIWAGVTAGGLVAGRAARLPSRGLALLIAAAGLTLAAGAGAARPAGILLVALAFGALQVAGVVAETRLQHVVTGPSRATVTSLSSLGVDVVSIAVYLMYGLIAGVGGDVLAFVVLALPYLLVGAWVLLGRADRLPVATDLPG
jgi:hypothetical protein